MFTVNWAKERDSTSAGLKERKRGSERRTWLAGCFYWILLSTRKLAKFTWMNEDSSSISLWLYSEADPCPLCMISPEECSYYVNWQCSLTWLAHVQRLFKQPTYTTPPTPTITTTTHTHPHTHTKVHVHIEPAHPIPLLQTIPTVFVNSYTLMLLNAGQISDQSHKAHTRTRTHTYMQGRKLGSKHKTTEKLNCFPSAALWTL